LKGCYGLVGCIVLILFNGVGAFIEPFNVRKFVSAYISVSPCLDVMHYLSEPTHVTCAFFTLTTYESMQLPTFLLLILGYNLRKHGLRFSDWWTDKSADLSNTVQATSLKRKGRLEFPDNGFTRENVLTFLGWIWVWMK
jgi:yeast amino acid transporter